MLISDQNYQQFISQHNQVQINMMRQQMNSGSGLTLNYSGDGEGTLTRKPGNISFLANGGSLPRSMALYSKEKVNSSCNDKSSVGQQQINGSCQQLSKVTTSSKHQQQSSPSLSSSAQQSTNSNKKESRLTKTITSPCLRKLRSTLFPGSRDSRRAPISVNNSTGLESSTISTSNNGPSDYPVGEDSEDNVNNNENNEEIDEDDIINPPLTTRSLSTPALNLQLTSQQSVSSSGSTFDYRQYPSSTLSHSSTLLNHHPNQQMIPIMANSLCNHYSGNMIYNNQPHHLAHHQQQQFNNNDSVYLRDNYDHLGNSRTYLPTIGASSSSSCNYAYPHQVYSNQQQSGLPYHLYHQQHLVTSTSTSTPTRANGNINSQQQAQCSSIKVDSNCQRLTNGNVEDIYTKSQQTISQQQQQYHHQQPTINANQSQHRFVEVCRPNELRPDDNYQTVSSLSSNTIKMNPKGNNNTTKSSNGQDSSTAILGSHIVVVSSYENNQNHGLTVKNSSSTSNCGNDNNNNNNNSTSMDVNSHHRNCHRSPDTPLSIDDECKTDNALNHMIVSSSSPDLAYKSSSSDSGRGTRTSESGSVEAQNSTSISPPLDITSLDSDQTDSHGTELTKQKQQTNYSNGHLNKPSTSQSSTLDKMQADLQKILDEDDELTSDGGGCGGNIGINISNGLGLSSLKNQCMRLPVVLESDSWVSDSSKTVDEPETKNSMKKSDSNGVNKKIDSTTTTSTPQQQQHQKTQYQLGSATVNQNLLTLNGKGEINGVNINKNGLMVNSKKVSMSGDKLQLTSVNSHMANGNCNTATSSNTNGQVKQTLGVKSKLASTNSSNGRYNTLSNGKGYGKLSSSKKWRNPNMVPEETGSVTTIGLESVDDVDDLTSEYTANTDAWETNNDNVHVRKQLSGLENMYSEILNLLGSRMHGAKKSMHHSSSGKLNRRISGSVSSLSVASRDAFYSRNNRHFNRREDFDSKGARRLKRLEGHVITLARSVSQLSSEIRSNQCLIEDVQTLRKDVDRIHEQLRCFKTTPLVVDGGTLKRSPSNMGPDPKDSSEKLRSEVIGNTKNNKLDKIKRFFGDEPPLRQFLKKLGYEKYTSKFDSEKIGLKELSALNEEKLIKLGIPMGPRVRILQELNKLQPPHSNIYLV